MRKEQEIIGHINGEQILVEKGLARAVLDSDRDKAYYNWLATGSREYDVAMKERITLPMKNGMLIVLDSDGNKKFDDRKLRFDGYKEVDGNKYIIRVAPTHFGETELAEQKAINSPEIENNLIKQGKKNFNDPFAYFARPFAINAVPITSEGYVHIFKRNCETPLYPGHWHVFGGHLDTDYSFLDNNDPSQAFRDLIQSNMVREFEEEGNVYDAQFQMIKFYEDYGAEFIHLGYIPRTSEKFLHNLTSARDYLDHTNLKVLKSPQEVENFIATEKKIVPTGKVALKGYLEQVNKK